MARALHARDGEDPEARPDRRLGVATLKSKQHTPTYSVTVSVGEPPHRDSNRRSRKRPRSSGRVAPLLVALSLVVASVCLLALHSSYESIIFAASGAGNGNHDVTEEGDAAVPIVAFPCNRTSLPPREFPTKSRTAFEAAGGQGAVLKYHGGPLLTDGLSLHFIWYGNWYGSLNPEVVTSLAKSLSASSYLAAMQRFGPRAKVAAPAITLAGVALDLGYSQGSLLTEAKVQAIIAAAITDGRLSDDPAGLYVVLASCDVLAEGFCDRHCGWHTAGLIGAALHLYAFIGDPWQCRDLCQASAGPGPNGFFGGDAMANVLAHEIAEVMTDPYQTGWHTASGQGVADVCAWDFGDTYAWWGDIQANVRLGEEDYLLQTLLGPHGACALAPANA